MTSPTPLEGESVKAFNAFRIYLDLDEKRSIYAVARKLHVSSTNIAKWCRRWKWVERVKSALVQNAEDQRAAEQRAKLERAREIERRRQQVQDMAWETGQQAIRIARNILRAIKKADYKEARAGDAARLMQVGDTLCRLATDMATARGEITAKNGQPLAPAVAPNLQIVIEEDGVSRRAKELEDEFFRQNPNHRCKGD
jgi:hypothetical protein